MMRMKTTLMIGILAAALMTFAAGAQTSSEAAPTDRLELKGLGIGDAKERVREVFPDIECSVPAEGLEVCTSRNATYAEQPAVAVVSILDGTTFEVRVSMINRETLLATVRPALVRRLGEPATSRRFDVIERQNFFWNRNNAQLQGDPMGDLIGGEYLGAMTLIDLGRIEEWNRRENPPPGPKVETNDL